MPLNAGPHPQEEKVNSYHPQGVSGSHMQTGVEGRGQVPDFAKRRILGQKIGVLLSS